MKPNYLIARALLTIVVAGGWVAVGRIARAAEPPAQKLLHADSRSDFTHRIPIYDENQKDIRPSDSNTSKTLVKPFSQLGTCGKCHDYQTIGGGWHFNANASVKPGRPGEPFIYYDPATRTQLPLSLRPWKGVYKPADIGMNDWEFVLHFGRHMPGGGIGEKPTDSAWTYKPEDKLTDEEAERADDPHTPRWHIAGKLEIDCMVCHSADATHDAGVRAEQVEFGNFQWASGVALGLGTIKGKPRFAKNMSANWDAKEAAKEDTELDPGPKLFYDLGQFNAENMVFLPVSKKPSASRCYFCHTTQQAVDRDNFWHSQTDVHLQAGLTCSDCHRHGIDHQVVRGYENEGQERNSEVVAAFSCKGCHMGVEGATNPEIAMGTRLGSPKPDHIGLPPIHFEKLSCTACHSGTFPGETPQAIQTSLAHALGIHSPSRAPENPPMIAAPIFLREMDAEGNRTGKIAPHKMVWPSFWGRLHGDKLTPISPTDALLKKAMSAAAAGKDKPLTADQITKALTALGDKAGQPVYVSAGKLHSLTGGKLASTEHPAAEPYAWPIGHDVRPAGQSLGARGCSDCHSTDSPIYFGKVAAAGFAPIDAALTRTMYQMRQDGGLIPTLFALSFKFRTMLKVLAFTCAAILALVILLGALRAIGWRPETQR